MVCLIDLCKAAAYIPPEYDQTALRTLAPELADDLRVSQHPQCASRIFNSNIRQNRIFNPTLPMKPFYETSDMIDVDLYADALVAIYRFSHAVAVKTIFPACISPDRSDAVKTCVLKACLSLVTEVGVRTFILPALSLVLHRRVRSRANRQFHRYMSSSLREREQSSG